MLYQACPDPLAGSCDVSRELSKEQARHRIGWLTGTYRTRKGAGRNRRRGKTVVGNNPAGFMHDHHGREAILLVGKRAGLQPKRQGWGSPQEMAGTSWDAVRSSGAEKVNLSFSAGSSVPMERRVEPWDLLRGPMPGAT